MPQEGSIRAPRCEVILADDLSGALEVAACFAGAGRKVTLPLGADPDISNARGLLVLSSETRNATADAARGSTRARCESLRRAGASLLFKKIDSTMRGPVGAELEAVAEEFPDATLVFCPANPDVGRTVARGILRVNGIEIADTPFRDDPRWPVRSSVVRSIADPEGRLPAASLSLETMGEGEAAVARALDSARSSGCRVLFCDAETRADLDTLASAARSRATDCLLVGSGGLGRALAENILGTTTPAPAGSHAANRDPAGRTAAVSPDAALRILYVVGSKHPSSHAQLDRLQRRVGFELFEFTPGESGAAERAPDLRLGEALRARGCAGIRFAKGVGGAAGVVEQLAAVVARAREVSAVVVTGGETAFALCRSLGARALEIVGELEPGVVATRADLEGRSLLMVTKPGGFGDEETFVRVHAWLASRGPAAAMPGSA